MSARHTELPWTFSPWHIEEGPSAVRAPQGHIVCCTASDDDAAYITTACNAYPNLLDALKAMVLNDRHTYRDCHKAALVAIARAEGRQP